MAENLNRHIASTLAAEDEVPAFVSLSKLLCLHLFKSDDWSQVVSHFTGHFFVVS